MLLMDIYGDTCCSYIFRIYVRLIMDSLQFTIRYGLVHHVSLLNFLSKSPEAEWKIGCLSPLQFTYLKAESHETFMRPSALPFIISSNLLSVQVIISSKCLQIINHIYHMTIFFTLIHLTWKNAHIFYRLFKIGYRMIRILIRASIHSITNDVNPWARTCQWTKFHQKIVNCRFAIKIHRQATEGPSNRLTDWESDINRFRK